MDLALYNTAFFEMQINTVDDDILSTISSENLCIFFHEYIHFLQDFTTFYGLHHIFCYSEYIHEVVNLIYRQKSKTIKVPVLKEKLHPNVFFNIEVKDLTLGDVNETIDKFEIKDIEVSTQTIHVSDVIVQKVSNVDVYCYNDKVFTFGQFAIKESVAYLMEQLTMPDVFRESPDYPYNSAEIIAAHYCKRFAANKFNVIALCDMSLMFSNPAEVFVDFMERVKRSLIMINKPEDVYCFFYDAIESSNSSFIGKYVELSEKVRRCLKSYIVDEDDDTESMYRWIDSIIDEGLSLRKQNRYWLLDIVREGNPLHNDFLIKLMRKIGSPLIRNSMGHYSIIPNQEKTNSCVSIFAILMQFLLLFRNGIIECRLYQWCESSGMDVDKRCKISPWERCNSAKLCPYAQIWRHWNLEKYTLANK